MNGRFVDITGQKFGRLYVLEFSHIACDQLARWKCRCECGNIIIAKGAALRKGNTNSCGCYKRDRITQANKKDITGKRFGKLVVIRDVGRKYGKVLWECKCDCENIIQVPAGDIRSGKYISCGCSKWVGENNPRWKGGNCITSGLYPPEWNKKLKSRIRKLDSNICKFPGCISNGNGRKLDVHHIDGNKRNCQDFNLISLCNTHHQYVESHGSKNFKLLFYSITRNR